MPAYLYHAHPDQLQFDAHVVDARPGAVVLDRSLLHPGGGGQLCDQAVLHAASGDVRIVEVRIEDGRWWHVLDQPLQLGGRVAVDVDGERRSVLARMHTATHVLNALVYQRFDGALVTGAQIMADGSGRMDFDLPDADNDALRVLDAELAREIQAARTVSMLHMPLVDAQAVHGLLRSAAVAPPAGDDGMIRLVDIEGLDRQACGGTHVRNTAEIVGVRIVKVENKGRRNRRVRLQLES